MGAVVRTSVAVLCGFLAMTIVVMVGTMAAAGVLVPEGLRPMGGPEAPLPALFLATNLLVSFGAAVVGGWVASRMDTVSGWRPILGLAALVLLMFATNRAAPRTAAGTPAEWYAWLLLALGVGGALVGGWLRLRRNPGSSLRLT